MKIGDIFTQGIWKYEVIGIAECGLPISRRIEKEEAHKEVPTEAPTKKEEAPKLTKTDVNRMSVDNLTALCKEMEIEPSTGSEMKKEIIAKLGL